MPVIRLTAELRAWQALLHALTKWSAGSTTNSARLTGLPSPSTTSSSASRAPGRGLRMGTWPPEYC
jgi:hypothetical protein